MKNYVNKNFPHFVHGGDYNPEQWIRDKSIWDEDMRLMNLANCNEMTVGIFSWSKLEPQEGKYDFSFLDEIIDKIYENGGRVILATPSGSRPRWLSDEYPEVLRVADNGVRNLYGTRHNHCYTSPVYREKVRQINTKLAERYGKHPAVIAWHLSNEYGGMCFCPLCEKAFREFVRKKYDNDIDKMNEAWWNTFWGHDYESFEQVVIPVPRGERCNHGIDLDFKRFWSYQTADFAREEAEAIRAVCPDLPITTNMVENAGINYRVLAEHLDFASWDSYPYWHSNEHNIQPYKTAFWHELFRTLKKKPFFLMESAPGLTNWQTYNKLKRPGMDRLASLQAVAMGSDSVQYFQWRKSRGGYEKFHGAVVDHAGSENTRVFQAVSSTGATLKKIDEVCGTQITASVALIYDWENRWAFEGAKFFNNKERKYTETCQKYYEAFWKRGINVDIIGLHDDISQYSLVVAPLLYMVDEQELERFESYVRNGGVIYATYFLGMVNDTDLCHLGGFPAGKLKDVFGIWNEELDTLYPNENVEVRLKDGKTVKGVECCELIHAQSAEILAKYDSEFYRGYPALTVNEYGKGRAYYQAFKDCGDLWEKMCSEILEFLSIKSTLPMTPPCGVTAHKRTDGENEYLFVQNYSDVAVSDINLNGEYTDMESGESCTTVSLKEFDVKILKKK